MAMHALKVLEFDAVLERLRSHCETPLAAAWASELRPSFEGREVIDLLGATQEAVDLLGESSLPPLGAVRDFRDALRRAAKGGVLGGHELFGIAQAMSAIRGLKALLISRRESLPHLGGYADALPEEKRLEDQLLVSLEVDGTLTDAASPALATLRARKKTTAARIVERIQSYTAGKTRELLSDPIYTVRDGRYVIPLKVENRGKIRGIVHDTSGSGLTLFLEPEDVVQLGNALREAEAAERAEEQRLLTLLSERVGAVAGPLAGGIEAASRVDLVAAKGRLAFEMDGVPPQTSGGSTSYVDVREARHPLLEVDRVVPLTITLGEANNVLITGPNTGGKTVAIKAVGLLVAMAQSGLFVPAREFRFAPFTQIWADIGDEQSLAQSLSTFSGHIKNISEALREIRPGALVLLDEVGAGTDPAEGAALAVSILEEMAAKGATILASTHYGELKAFAYSNSAFMNAAMEFDAKTLRPTYRLMQGAAGASHALRIAERYGIPRTVVERAREKLGSSHLDMAEMLERLETAQKQARTAQSEADRRTAELRAAEAQAARRLREAEEIRRTANAKAQEAIEAALREIRLEAQRLFEELKASPRDGRTTERVRQELKDLDSVGRAFAAEIAPSARRPKAPAADLAKGATVRLAGHQQTGTILEEPRDGKALVQIGPLKMTVPLNRLEATTAAPEAPARVRNNLRLQRAMTAHTEIVLINQRAEDALRDLERFVDDAVLAGLPSLRIVHGKGEGKLRKATQDFLKRHPAVASYRDGEPAEGGAGVTIAALR